jgi:hypothetical protein
MTDNADRSVRQPNPRGKYKSALHAIVYAATIYSGGDYSIPVYLSAARREVDLDPIRGVSGLCHHAALLLIACIASANPSGSRSAASATLSPDGRCVEFHQLQAV